MALVANIRPIDRHPDHNETRSAYCEGEGDLTLVTGSGNLQSITVGVAGTLLTVYDATAADSPSDANTILVVATADITDPKKFVGPPIAFARGLRLVTTGSGTELTVGFRGAQTVSTKRYYP